MTPGNFLRKRTAAFQISSVSDCRVRGNYDVPVGCTSERLLYNYYRDYDTSTGRYLQSDPIGILKNYDGPQRKIATLTGIPIYGDLSVAPNHTYGYAEQNPLIKIDPTGEVGIAVPIGIGVTFCSKFPQLCINGARAVGAAIGSAIAMCFEDDEEDDNCEALYKSTLRTCDSLTGRKKFKCYEAARINRDQCYQERNR